VRESVDVTRALQCVAVRCSALQCVAVRCSALRSLRFVAVRCSEMEKRVGKSVEMTSW